MDPLTILNDIRIAEPCPAPWSEMKGDDRARFCESCERHVYNIAMLPAAEAVSLIERHEGSLCVRLYRRRDGTVLTADCPVGRSIAARSRLRRFAAGAVMGITMLAAGAVYKVRAASGAGPEWSPPPSGPGVTVADWKDWALEVLGILPRRSGVVAGGICAPPPVIAVAPPVAEEGEAPPVESP